MSMVSVKNFTIAVVKRRSFRLVKRDHVIKYNNLPEDSDDRGKYFVLSYIIAPAGISPRRRNPEEAL